MPAASSEDLGTGGERLRLPVAVYLWPTGRSYTGQPMAEVHTIGSPPLLEAVLNELHRRGVRSARPGEFTLRAFLAGRLDLVQAEAVLGVIDAHDHEQLETALSQLAGGISGRIGRIRGDLLDLLADIEAGLDFVEEDIEFVARDELVERLAAARGIIHDILAQAESRIQSKGRLKLVLAGLPNAGKSTLFNALSGREAALVSETAGTTRDWLTAEINWDGLPLEVIDTAGWEVAEAGIMHAAQALRRDQLERCDLIVWCTPAALDEAQRSRDAELRREASRQGHPLIHVRTKCDLAAASGAAECVAVSARTGAGLPELRQAIAAAVSQNAGRGELLGTTASRCRESLSAAITALERAERTAALSGGDELLAIEIREALSHLGLIVGDVYTDDLLDRIFSKFCIGK